MIAVTATAAVDFYVEVAAGFEFLILSGLKQRANSSYGRDLGLYVSVPVNVVNVLPVVTWGQELVIGVRVR